MFHFFPSLLLLTSVLWLSSQISISSCLACFYCPFNPWDSWCLPGFYPSPERELPTSVYSSSAVHCIWVPCFLMVSPAGFCFSPSGAVWWPSFVCGRDQCPWPAPRAAGKLLVCGGVLQSGLAWVSLAESKFVFVMLGYYLCVQMLSVLGLYGA